mmetsp:Transcript_1798/g.5910  ORF Transcript_1798/g.5910 Transcript_1798/m.5910 type:complete len:210 (-) Transcript_1798:2855-3484(-)
MQSCMMPFHDSPVDIRNSKSIELGKSSKFAKLVMNSCRLMYPNRFMPMTAKMKKNRNRTLPTFTSAGSEKMSVCSNARRPFARLMSRNTRAMRNTRSRDRYDVFTSDDMVITKPMMEMATTTKSKRFHFSVMYALNPMPITFRQISRKNTTVKQKFVQNNPFEYSSVSSAWFIDITTMFAAIKPMTTRSNLSCVTMPYAALRNLFAGMS